MQERKPWERTDCAGCRRAEEAEFLRRLREITGRGNNAEVRERDGRLILYEVKKSIAAR